MSNMDNSEINEKLQLLVVRYLYGDMNPEELLEFKQQLVGDVSLRALLEEEQQLQASFPVGTQPKIDSNRVQGNQWQLQKKLLRLSRRGFSIKGYFHDLLQKPGKLIIQLSAMAATFVLGLILAQQDKCPG